MGIPVTNWLLKDIEAIDREGRKKKKTEPEADSSASKYSTH